MKTNLLPAFLLLAGVSAALPGVAASQDHLHAAPSTNPILRIALEGPHLVLAHDGFIELSDDQVRSLRLSRSAVCGAEEAYVEERGSLRSELAGLLAEGAAESRLLPVLQRLASADAEWMLTLVRARAETLAGLTPAQREQAQWLGDHWMREAGEMITAATLAGTRGHPGMQIPIRVPGMVVSETSLAPFCESLHGPPLHLSMPPPP
jgi:hypothetical protein